MNSTSLLKTTAISQNNYVWKPVSFLDFLAEFNHIKNSIGEACLYRGHSNINWLIDSTFSRSLKQMFNMPITQRYPEQALESIEFQHSLARRWLQKIDAIQLHSKLLEMEGQVDDLYFEYHKHHQQNPDDEYINDKAPKGTNFIDFSYDWKVGLFFANSKRDENEEGVLIIVRQTALGPAHLQKPFLHTIDSMRKALSISPIRPYTDLPLLVYPKKQMNNILDPKPQRQNAVYIAQMDFRYDVGLSWEDFGIFKGKQVYIKLVLPSGTKKEVDNFLETHGITYDYLFPPTQFDKKASIL